MGVTIIDLMSDEDIIVIKDEHEEKEKKQANSYVGITQLEIVPVNNSKINKQTSNNLRKKKRNHQNHS
jgi:hypothetical protein